MSERDEKNRKETERRILGAVTELVKEAGFDNLGINAIARKAGVSKVLIYRYFKGRDNLLRQWSLENNYWAKGEHHKLVETGASLDELRKLTGEILLKQYDFLRSETVLREILRWQIASKEEVCGEVMQIAEEAGTRTMNSFNQIVKTDLDTDAIIAILLGGIYYLQLLSDRAPVFNNIILNSAEGDDRIKKGLNQIIDLFFSKIEKEEED